MDDNQAEERGVALKKTADSDESSIGAAASSESAGTASRDLGEDGAPLYHQLHPDSVPDDAKPRQRDFRKRRNQEAREAAAQSIHKGIRLIVHHPDVLDEHRQEYARLSKELMPIVREMARQALPLLEYESSSEWARNRYYGSKFVADSVAYRDYKHFAKRRPPTESPSLAVGLRVDESASMSAFGRLEAAKRAALAVYEFCRMCELPVCIYGDTADASRLEQMSIFAYTDFEKADPEDRFRLMGMRARSNNRDGLALRILGDRLAAAPQQTKLLISISDGQPKARDDYTGSCVIQDMQQTIAGYERKGVAVLAAAIGQDKEVISQIYGAERFLDMTNLQELPVKLVRLIARYM
ncbi:nitric oxide reductase activation protein NorD [Paenibacillus melissococcoides]|uniref:Nitric oxide reductase activation protein NorD n=1 Tax=Paenibacillus melissococcoides TaxID=2912268 RepID=A0ABN8U2J1_9BACL|nr:MULTISPECIES: nitric oxide reductase activation protein NorD [Paenibacillus]MEB9896910.1 nitric oxide reductase activation protein NorD [Bacillus cereus]GIO82469.1 hypothetical protein J6TS7_60790 [Paenibacillus dendritiformis]CAH8244423.1 nitric oxide reductase activation protein NorD [Paenibacillus melissococcoides]CAH8703238.1 nitric oxide reductase activation protein NorD [Paenibacillus melissococcoides]